MKKILIFLLIFIILLAGGLFVLKREAKAPDHSDHQTSNQTQPDDNKPHEEFNKSQYSLDDPNSLWVVVNKKQPISTSFTPENLVKPNVQTDVSDSDGEQKIRNDVAGHVEKMFADAKSAGFNLMFASGYRSASLQAMYYNNYVARDGEAAANKYSARPGTSEHQTGLAFDVSRTDRKCYLETCFADMPEAKWLAENAHKYGFTLRYKKDKEAITGYQYEPWHFRYVGVELAGELQKTNQTLEEFFGL